MESPWIDIQSEQSAESDDRLGPSQHLLIRVLQLLDRAQHPEAPGYCVIVGIDHFAPDLESADAFQISLMGALWNLGSPLWNADAFNTRMNVFRANDGRLPIELVGRSVTYKRLHIDPHSILFAHRYEPPKNLRGGDLILTDVRQYLRDHDLTLSDTFYSLYGKHDEGRLVSLDEHREAMLENYSKVVPAPTAESILVIVRNDPIDGVAHEVSEISPIDASLPWERTFLRTSISPIH